MTDLVQNLAGALEECLDDSHQVLAQMEQMYGTNYRQDRLEAQRKTIAAAEAALSEAKAGGWVAVPVEPTPEMVEAARDVKRQRLARAVAELKQGKRPDTIGMALSVNEEWAAMLAARPLPAPPAQRGEG